MFFSCSGNRSTDPDQDLTDSLSLKKTTTDTNIYIAFTAYNQIDTTLVTLLMKNAEKFYKVKSLPIIHATLLKQSYNAAWDRYSADSLLQQLKKIKPEKADYIQGLTDRDIFTPTEKSP